MRPARRSWLGWLAVLAGHRLALQPCSARLLSVQSRQVIRRANATEYGLAGAVWTRGLDRMQAVTRGVKAGTIWGEPARAWLGRALRCAAPGHGWRCGCAARSGRRPDDRTSPQVELRCRQPRPPVMDALAPPAACPPAACPQSTRTTSWTPPSRLAATSRAGLGASTAPPSWSTTRRRVGGAGLRARRCGAGGSHSARARRGGSRRAGWPSAGAGTAKLPPTPACLHCPHSCAADQVRHRAAAQEQGAAQLGHHVEGMRRQRGSPARKPAGGSRPASAGNELC